MLPAVQKPALMVKRPPLADSRFFMKSPLAKSQPLFKK
jgi:hypothetical protein